MRILPKTKALFVVVLVLLLANLWKGDSPVQGELPKLSGVSKDLFQKIELTQSGQKILFEKENGVWFLRAPSQAKADQARVKSLLLNFRKEIAMDVMIEKGNEEDYGLDASHSIVVELWTEGTEPAISFTLGNNSARGSSFVRLLGDDAVYRARLGGRHRYEHSVSDWKNRLLFDFQEKDLKSLLISSPRFSYSMLKEGEEWQMIPKPTWSIDQKRTRSIMARIGSLRIGSSWKEAITKRDLSLQIAQKDGAEKTANIQLSDFAVVEIDGKRYRSSTSVLKNIAEDADFFRDKKIFQFNPRSDVDTISYLQEDQKIVFQQDLSNGFWRVIEPIGMDIDMKQVFFMVNSLSSAQALSFVDTPLEDPRVQITFRMLNGSQEVLNIGEEANGVYTAQKGDSTFLLSKELVQKIQQAFGKGF